MIDTFETELVEFAKSLREKATKESTPLEESTNAFKALTAFYAILRKFKPESDNGDGQTFDDLQKEVRDVVEQESLNGGASPAVRNRSRRSGSPAADSQG